MKKIIFFAFLFIININSNSFANSKDCKEFKKFSVEYFKCKANIVKDKTIYTGQNIIKDTKDYQNQRVVWRERKLIKQKKRF